MATQSFGKFEKVLRIGEGRRLKRLAEQAAYIGTLEPDFEALSDDELAARPPSSSSASRTASRSRSCSSRPSPPSARRASARSAQRLFDVQLMGGIVLHEGDIAEMKTGEGKTFVAMHAALPERARRHGRPPRHGQRLPRQARRRVERSRVYERLGMHGRLHREHDAVRASAARRTRATSPTGRTPSSASTTCATTWPSRSTASSSAATPTRSWTRSTRSSIDEARTPLIISGEPETAAADLLRLRARSCRSSTAQPATRKAAKGEDETELSGADYLYDEKFKTVSPAQSAIEKVERALGIENLYDPRNVQLVNHLNQALKAQSLYQRDVDYVVQDGEVKIVDEFTGRIMEGRRWSEGLHQAIEAKEGVRIQEENVTLATITLQNYFRLYEKLAGMTGTAKTEEKEFVEIYNLHVVEIPTNVAGRARTTRTTSSSRRRRRSSQPSSRTSRSATRRGSRSSSARSRSRPPSTSRELLDAARASRTTS